MLRVRGFAACAALVLLVASAAAQENKTQDPEGPPSCLKSCAKYTELFNNGTVRKTPKQMCDLVKETEADSCAAGCSEKELKVIKKFRNSAEACKAPEGPPQCLVTCAKYTELFNNGTVRKTPEQMCDLVKEVEADSCAAGCSEEELKVIKKFKESEDACDGEQAPKCIEDCPQFKELNQDSEVKKTPGQVCTLLTEMRKDTCMANCSTGDHKIVIRFQSAAEACNMTKEEQQDALSAFAEATRAEALAEREQKAAAKAAEKAKALAAREAAKAEKARIRDEKKAALAKAKEERQRIRLLALEAKAKLLAGLKSKRAQARAAIIAEALATGGKIKEIRSAIKAATAEDACAQMCTKMKVNCTLTYCEAKETAAQRRHRQLLSTSYDATVQMSTADVDAEAAEKALKDSGLTVQSETKEPAEELKTVEGVDPAAVADMTKVGGEAAAAEAVVKEGETEVAKLDAEVQQLETEVKAAQAEKTEADKELESAEKEEPLSSPAAAVAGTVISLAAALLALA